MSAMNEIWRQAIDLWRDGGVRGVNQAVSFLRQCGWETRRDAKLQLQAAIKIYKGETNDDRDA
jgi:hypothetical protein